jgi:hypothetical protein
MEMSQLAHMPWVPQEHDQFVTKGGWGRPVCVEYSAMSPGGHKWGMVSPGTVLIAKEVRVARMPSQCLVGGPPDWTIAIRCRSTHYHHRGEDCWVNITRGGQRFANPSDRSAMAGRSSQEAEFPTRTLREMSLLANFPWVPQEHDQFVTKGGCGRPACVEYSAMSPGGDKWGVISPGTVLIAKEVRVARMPSQHLSGGPQDWTIAIRCPSTYDQHRGEDCWVNITRGGQRFATPRFMPLHRGSTDDLRFGPLVGRGSWYPERWRRSDRPY